MRITLFSKFFFLGRSQCSILDRNIVDLAHNPKIRNLHIPTSCMARRDRADWFASVLSTIRSEVIHELHIPINGLWTDAEYEKLDLVLATDPRFSNLKNVVSHFSLWVLDREPVPRMPRFSARGNFEIRYGGTHLSGKITLLALTFSQDRLDHIYTAQNTSCFHRHLDITKSIKYE